MRYPTYRPAHLAWLSEIPAEWELKPLKLVVSKLVAGGTPDTSVESNWTDEGDGTPWVAISDMTRDRVVKRTEKRVTQHALREKRLQVLPAGTLLYSMYASLGKVARLALPAVTNQAILGIVPRPEQVDGLFLERWLEHFEQHVVYLSNGNTQDNLNAAKVRSIPVCVPSLQEQQGIAAFLDRKTAAIDALIAKKERLIALLQEKRQALITQAVTKGLDPNVRMKDSGFPLLGRVPETWEVIGVKHVTRFITSGSRGWSDYIADEGALFLQSGNLDRRLGLDLQGVQRVQPPAGAEGRRTRVQVDDVLVCITGAYTGNVGVVRAPLGDAYVNQHLALVRTNRQRVNPVFLALLLSSRVGASQFLAAQYGGTKQGLGLQDVCDVRLGLPSVDAQNAIVQYVERFVRNQEEVERLVRTQIGTLREYRQALITAAVTGKIDVSTEAA